MNLIAPSLARFLLAPLNLPNSLRSSRYDQLRDPTSAMRENIRDQHRKTLRQAIHVWLDQYPEDFQEPPNYPCLTQLENFCQRVMPDSELDLKVDIKGIVEPA